MPNYQRMIEDIESDREHPATRAAIRAARQILAVVEKEQFDDYTANGAYADDDGGLEMIWQHKVSNVRVTAAVTADADRASYCVVNEHRKVLRISGSVEDVARKTAGTLKAMHKEADRAQAG